MAREAYYFYQELKKVFINHNKKNLLFYKKLRLKACLILKVENIIIRASKKSLLFLLKTKKR